MSGSDSRAHMSPIVTTVSGWVSGFILLYGIQVILYGHLSPGGGFTGGVIAATSFVLLIVVQGDVTAGETYSRRAASALDCVGALLFWLMAVLGIAVAGIFFWNFIATPAEARLTLFSAGIIPGCNVAVGLKVCSSIYLIVLVLAALAAPDSTQKKESTR